MSNIPENQYLNVLREISRHEYNLLMIVCNLETCGDGDGVEDRVGMGWDGGLDLDLDF